MPPGMEDYPIIFAACEALDPDSLQWLLDHGADPNCGSDELWKTRGVPHPGTALDYLLGAYVRAPEVLSTCIDILLKAGGNSKYQDPAVMAVIRNRLNDLEKLLGEDQSLVHRQFPALDFGTSGGRMLTLRGATLLHVAAEFGNLDAVRLLLDRGAEVNGKAAVDEHGIGGQTAIFHAATQGADFGLSIVRFLVDRGADLTVRAKLPGTMKGQTKQWTAHRWDMRFCFQETRARPQRFCESAEAPSDRPVTPEQTLPTRFASTGSPHLARSEGTDK